MEYFIYSISLTCYENYPHFTEEKMRLIEVK